MTNEELEGIREQYSAPSYAMYARDVIPLLDEIERLRALLYLVPRDLVQEIDRELTGSPVEPSDDPSLATPKE